MSFDATIHPHRRLNLLTGEHVLVSPQRALRPWQGQEDPPETEARPTHDPSCYLCPGGTRANGTRNPDYPSVLVFDNDFAALASQTPAPPATCDPLFVSTVARGESRVVCFSPDHSATLPQLSKAQIEAVIDCWCAECSALGKRYPWVQVFENKGAMMGCSNPHPHGQIWGSEALPTEIVAEDERQRDWHIRTGRPLLLQLAEREAELGERVVAISEDWLSIVPFWASWPFETLLLPRFPVARLDALTPGQRASLAQMLKRLTTRYDNLFKTSFPYSMGWHGAPYGQDEIDHWQLHAHFYPPLLRSASVRKFMVGYELLAEAQRDLTPEAAAVRLAALSDVRFAP